MSGVPEKALLAKMLSRHRRRWQFWRLAEFSLRWLFEAWPLAVLAALARWLWEPYPWASLMLPTLPLACWVCPRFWPRFPAWIRLESAIMFAALVFSLPFYPVPPLGLAAGFVLLGGFSAWFRLDPITLDQVALLADRQWQRQELILTAWQQQPAATPLEAAFAAHLHAQALLWAGKALDFKTLSRRRWALGLSAGVSLVLLQGLHPLSLPATASWENAPQLAAEMKKAIAKLPPEAAAPLQELQSQLKTGQIAPMEAMARLAEMRQDLQKRLQNAEELQEARRQLASAIPEISKLSSPGASAEELAKTLRDASPARRQEIQETLQKMAAQGSNPQFQQALSAVAKAMAQPETLAASLRDLSAQADRIQPPALSPQNVSKVLDAMANAMANAMAKAGEKPDSAEASPEPSSGKSPESESSVNSVAGQSHELGAAAQPGGTGGVDRSDGAAPSASPPKVQAPRSIASQGSQESIEGAMGGPAERFGAPRAVAAGQAPAVRSFAQALPQARQLAEKALEQQQIPAQYQDIIREYYR